MGKLTGKIAVITGGNSGIGFATAKHFVDEGAKVVITGRRAEAVEKAASELGPDAVGIVSDAGKLDDIERLIEEVKNLHGQIDILYLNAGTAPVAPIEAQQESVFDDIYRTHVKGPFFTVQKALPLLKDGSSVIFISSAVNRKGFPGLSAYSAAKAALRSLTRTLAAELAPRGVRVNSLSPGPIETPIYDKMGMSDKQSDEFSENIENMVPLGRFGSAEEITPAAVFLASDDSSYVTGTEIDVDGGIAQV